MFETRTGLADRVLPGEEIVGNGLADDDHARGRAHVASR
jgi:hypothetical protein